MKSYHLSATSPDGLEARNHPTPEPGPGQLLVRMRANALSLRELKVLEGKYPLPITPGVVAGCEGVGEVVALGPGVVRAEVGDRVAATVFPQWLDGPFSLEYAAQLGSSLDGMLTEYAVINELGVVPIPTHLSYEEAAALPLVALTAWNAVFGGRGVLPGETVLTLGSGGVSLFALQFAKLAGARVIATSSSKTKADHLRDLGADEVVDYTRSPTWYDEVRHLTNSRGADHVIDVAGVLTQSVRAATFGGEVTLVGISQGLDTNADPLPAATIFAGGVTIRPLAVGSRAQFQQMTRAITQAKLRPVIDRVFPFGQVPEALAYYRKGSFFGKVVITHSN